QFAEEDRAILIEALSCDLAELAQQSADSLLAALAFRDFFQPDLLVLLLARGQRAKCRLQFQPSDALRACLKVEPQRAFDRDLVKTEVGIVEDLADYEFFLFSIDGEAARFAISKVAVDAGGSRRSGLARAGRRAGRRPCCACCPGSSSS